MLSWKMGLDRELRRLVEAVGLKLDSVWLSGEPWAELSRAAGSGTLMYQWRKNGVNLTGEMDSSLILLNVSVAERLYEARE